MSLEITSGEKLSIDVNTLTKEDLLILRDGKVVIERGLVLHGCKPNPKIGDIIIAANNKQFKSAEELTQFLMEMIQSRCKLTLAVSRQKSHEEVDNKIDRYVIELKKTSVKESFGVSPIVQQNYVFVAKVDALAAEAGVREKDHIKRINNEAVQSLEDFERLVKDQQKIVLYIARGSKIAINPVEFETKMVCLHIPYETGDLLGITMKNLVVTDIQSGSVGENKFELQDKIMDLNGRKLSDDQQFYDWLQRIDEDLEINVMRKVAKMETDGKACESSSSTATINRVLISLSMAPCEALGVRPDENLMISRIMDKSHAQGKFELGDVIKKLNGIPITDREQFFKLFEDATSEGRVNIIVERSAERELELEKRLLPPNIEKIIKRHAGFDYIVVNVRYDSSAGRPFGLNIANVTSHKIIIPELAENAVASDYLKAYDHIIAINGNPVSDVTVAKKMIRECRANFQAVVERPITLESNAEIKREVDEWKKRMARPTNLEQMPRDVQDIVEKHFKDRKSKKPVSLISLLRKSVGKQRKIHFSERHIETQIQSDTPPTKRLRSCR